MEESVSSATQKYIISRNNYNQGTIVSVTDSQGEVLFSTALEERVNYMLYSSPEMNNSETYSFKAGNTAVKTSVEKCQIILEESSYIYDGTAKEPEVTVKYQGRTLTRNTDYTISYRNNINAGTAEVTITGIGNYTGIAVKEFVIQERQEQKPGQSSEDNSENKTEQVAKEKPAQAANVSASSASTSKIKVTWKKTEGAEGYQIDRYNRKKKSWQCIKIISGGNTESYTDCRLTSGTAYKYRVCAYVEIDGKKVCGSYSKTAAAATKPAKCAIKNLRTKKKSLTIKWKKTTGSGYEICYSTKKDFSAGVRIRKVSSASKTSVTIKNLKSENTYYVKIRAYKKVGNTVYRGAYGQVKKITIA